MPNGGWTKVAYVQLLREHIHVCNAVMIFAELDRQESLAQRLLLYPKEWHDQQSGQRNPDVHIETSLRLLKNAAKRYKVELEPVDRIGVLTESVSNYRLHYINTRLLII